MPAIEATGPTWNEYKAKLVTARTGIENAQTALLNASLELKQAHNTLQEAIGTPPGQIPTIGDGPTVHE